MLEGAFENTGSSPGVYVVGSGPVGTTLAARLKQGGVNVVGLQGRSAKVTAAAAGAAGVPGHVGPAVDALSGSALVIVAVKDGAIAEAARGLLHAGLGRHHTLLHTSGAWPAAAIFGDLRSQVAAVGTMHPLLSLNRGAGAADLTGATFAVEGDDAARAQAQRLVTAMGCRWVGLDAEGMARYHAGAALASNALVGLVTVAAQALTASGIPPEQSLSSLLPLVKSTVANIERLGLPDALTGPVVRGDTETVHRHVQALGDQPEALDVYRVLGRQVLELAKQRGLADATVAALEKLLRA